MESTVRWKWLAIVGMVVFWVLLVCALAHARSIDVRDYGVACDGSQDDTPYIIAAATDLLNHPESEDGAGGELVFPSSPNPCLFTALDFHYPTQMRHLLRIRGQGSGTKTLGTAPTVLRCIGNGPAIMLGRAIVQDLRLENGGSATHGLYFYAANTDSRIQDVTIDGFPVGIWWYGFSGSIRDSKLTHNDVGIYLTGNAVDISRNTIESWNGAAIEVDNCTQVNILLNTIESGTGPAVKFRDRDSVAAHIHQNYFENIIPISPSDGAIRVVEAAMKDGTISENTFNLSAHANISAVYSKDMRYSTIRGNKVYNAVAAAYNWVSGGLNIGNTIEDSSALSVGSSYGIGYIRQVQTIPGVGAAINQTFRGRVWHDIGGLTQPADIPAADDHYYGLVNGDGGTKLFTPLVLQNRGTGTLPGMQIKAMSGVLSSPSLVGALQWLRQDSLNGTVRLTINRGGVETPVISADSQSLTVGCGTWQMPLMLGAYALWVDSDGRLRIKNGRPSWDNEGSVVGTQE